MKEITFEGRLFTQPNFINDAKCHSKTAIAIKNKTIKRQSCEICGKLPTDAHHEIYSNYLNIRWLCRSHHLRLHAIFRQFENRNTYAYL